MFFELLLQHINTINLKRFISTKLAKTKNTILRMVFFCFGMGIWWRIRTNLNTTRTMDRINNLVIGESVGLSMMCYTLGKEKRMCFGDFQLSGLIGKLLY